MKFTVAMESGSGFLCKLAEFIGKLQVARARNPEAIQYAKILEILGGNLLPEGTLRVNWIAFYFRRGGIKMILGLLISLGCSSIVCPQLDMVAQGRLPICAKNLSLVCYGKLLFFIPAQSRIEVSKTLRYRYLFGNCRGTVILLSQKRKKLLTVSRLVNEGLRTLSNLSDGKLEGSLMRVRQGEGCEIYEAEGSASEFGCIILFGGEAAVCYIRNYSPSSDSYFKLATGCIRGVDILGAGIFGDSVTRL